MKIAASIVTAVVFWLWALASVEHYLMPRDWLWRWWGFPAYLTFALVLIAILGVLVQVTNSPRSTS